MCWNHQDEWLVPWRAQAQAQGCFHLRKMQCRCRECLYIPLREEHGGREHVGQERVQQERVRQQEHVQQEHVGRQVWFKNGMPSWDVF